MSSEQTFQLVNDSVALQLSSFYENIAKDSAVKAVLKCAEMYGFDGNEAIQRLGLVPLNVTVKTAEPVPVVNEEKNEVVVNNNTAKSVPPATKSVKKSMVISKPAFPLPYSGEMDENLCFGLVLNEALFTQCQTFPKDGVYCPKCAKQCSTNENGKPTYGTIQDRKRVGIMDYVDPKNRVPVEYVKVMNKYKVSREQVIAEASKHNMTIDPIHFEIADKKKGRPKNPTTRVVENTNEPDLFKDLISSKPTVEISSPPAIPTKVDTKVDTKVSNAKDEEKQRKLEEKKQKDAEKQRKLDEKMEEKKQKEAEKQRKLEEKKKPNEASKKKAAAPKKKAEEVKNPPTPQVETPTPTTEEESDVFTTLNDTINFNYNGKEYFRSLETNNVYKMEDDGYANMVGRYDEATKSVIYSGLNLYEDEECEEAYDEDGDDYGCGEDDDEDEYDNLIEEFDQQELECEM